MVTQSKMEGKPCVGTAAAMPSNKGSATGTSPIMGNVVNLLTVRDPSDFVRQFLADNPLFLSSAVDDYIRPLYQNGDIVLDVECGLNQGLLYLSRLCQGSRGPCILYQDSWLTPNEFQLISGRETAKDWKRSIRHCGKSMKLLLTKGILSTHPLTCECDSCRLSSMSRSGRGGATKNYGSQTGLSGVVSSNSGDQDKEDDSYEESYTEPDCYISPSPSPSLPHAVSETDSEIPSVYSRIMETLRPTQSSESELNESDRKRENRLTSIIDQLLSNRVTKVQDLGEKDLRSLVEFQKEIGDTKTVAPSPFESTPEGNPIESEQTVPVATLPVSKSPANATRRKKQKIQVKTERYSPESSRSDSPHSPVSTQSLQRTPSYPGTPPTLSFTPPASSYSPHQQNPKNMESHMSRNYSDFMRSLAAKYNNNNTANEFLTAAAASRGTGFLAGIDPRFQQAFKPGSVPFLGLNPLHPLAALANHHQQQTTSHSLPSKKEFEHSSSSSGTKSKDSIASAPATVPPQPAALMMAGSFPMIDMSSTQALLHMVRSASAQQNTNEQMETYLRGAIKRPADSPLSSTSASLASPLDLSGAATILPNPKRAHLDSPVEHNKTFRETYDVNPSPAKQNQTTMSVPTRTPVKQSQHLCMSTCAGDCSPESKTVQSWTVDQVAQFVASIDLCAEYAEVFRDHCIDGAALSLLTESHLTNNMKLKLGPALKFKTVLAKKLGHCALCLHCVHCHGQHSSSNHQEADVVAPSFSLVTSEVKKSSPAELKRPSSIN